MLNFVKVLNFDKVFFLRVSDGRSFLFILEENLANEKLFSNSHFTVSHLLQKN